MILRRKGVKAVFRPIIMTVTVQVVLFLALIPLALAKSAGETTAAKPLETVSGVGCYAYGDNETPAQAKQAAQSIAQEKAVRSHRVFVQSATKVKNFQLEDNVIQTASAGMLEQVKVEKEEKDKGRVICKERQEGYASRSFTLACPVDGDHADANYKDGVLALKLPKKAATSAKRLAIQ